MINTVLRIYIFLMVILIIQDGADITDNVPTILSLIKIRLKFFFLESYIFEKWIIRFSFKAEQWYHMCVFHKYIWVPNFFFQFNEMNKFYVLISLLKKSHYMWWNSSYGYFEIFRADLYSLYSYKYVLYKNVIIQQTILILAATVKFSYFLFKYWCFIF